MRIKLFFQLENNKIDIQYRKSLISFLKKCVQDYDENLYKDLYEGNKIKTFAFAPILPKPVFNENHIELQENKIIVWFTLYNYAYALHIYNAILMKKNCKFSLDKNSMTLESITMIPEKKIRTNTITIRMLSPMIIRNHNQITKKDMYYSYEKGEFYKYIRINIGEELKSEGLDRSLLNDFSIKPIDAKKTVIKNYEKMLEASIGIFRIEGKKELLELLYKMGIRF